MKNHFRQRSKKLPVLKRWPTVPILEETSGLISKLIASLKPVVTIESIATEQRRAPKTYTVMNIVSSQETQLTIGQVCQSLTHPQTPYLATKKASMINTGDLASQK
jgi:hypothetical protein